MTSSPSMLTAVPRHLFSGDYRVFEGEVFVALLDLSWLREKGKLILADRRFEIGRENPVSGAFFLSEGEEILATAEKPSAFHRRFEVDACGRGFTLEAVSSFGRRFALREGGREIGSISPVHAFTRRAVVDLPESLPLEVRVFLTWLVILLWKRTAAQGAN